VRGNEIMVNQSRDGPGSGVNGDYFAGADTENLTACERVQADRLRDGDCVQLFPRDTVEDKNLVLREH